MTFIELFAGIGGFRYGLESVCIKDSQQKNKGTGNKAGQFEQQFNQRSNRYTCVYANEWDKYAATIYEKNFGERPDTRSITDVDVTEIPDHDLLVGGFPCQAFSIAGKRRGFDDIRGTLFFEIARILQHKRPRYLLLENVKGLLSHESGKTFQTILGVLTDLGYLLQWEVLNSKNFGVPQNRERVFIIGHLRGQRRPEVFPIRESSTRDNTSQSDDSISRTVSARFKKGVGNSESRIIDVLINVPQAQRIRNIQGLASTLQGLSGGQGAKTGLYKINSDIRRLTPIECERLQGFPDNWTAGVSDTQRYKMLGNAVTTNVITYLGKRLLEATNEP